MTFGIGHTNAKNACCVESTNGHKCLTSKYPKMPQHPILDCRRFLTCCMRWFWVLCGSHWSSMDPIVFTDLAPDLPCVLTHNLARFDNNASACYSRIIVALGTLAGRQCGKPENGAIWVHAAEASLFMKYTVKTEYGVSETSYQGTGFEPL